MPRGRQGFRDTCRLANECAWQHTTYELGRTLISGRTKKLPSPYDQSATNTLWLKCWFLVSWTHPRKALCRQPQAMDRYEQPVIFGLLNAAPLQLVKHEELGSRQFMHSPTTTSNVQDSDRHQLLRSLLHAGQGVPSKALARSTGCNFSCCKSDDPRPSVSDSGQ